MEQSGFIPVFIFQKRCRTYQTAARRVGCILFVVDLNENARKPSLV